MIITAIHQTRCHDVITDFEINNQCTWIDFALKLNSLSHFTRVAVL